MGYLPDNSNQPFWCPICASLISLTDNDCGSPDTHTHTFCFFSPANFTLFKTLLLQKSISDPYYEIIFHKFQKNIHSAMVLQVIFPSGTFFPQTSFPSHCEIKLTTYSLQEKSKVKFNLVIPSFMPRVFLYLSIYYSV